MEHIYTLKSPLAHNGKTETTGAIFLKIKTAYGEIPAYTGNAIRGQLRDSGANYLFKRLGIKTDKENILNFFSGGMLGGSVKANLTKAHEIRTTFPLLSVFGGSFSDIMLAGLLNVGFLYPICKETEQITGIESDLSFRNLLGYNEFNKTDDSKNPAIMEHCDETDTERKDGERATQMRYGVQYLAPLTQMWGKIDTKFNTDLEAGAYYSCWVEFLDNHPRLGGMANKGFGDFHLDRSFIDMDKVKLYNDFLANNDFDFSILKAKKGKNEE